MQKITRRKDGRYSAMVNLGRDPETGKLIRKTVYGKTKSEVRERVRETEAKAAAGGYALSPSGGKTTVSQWSRTWLGEYAATRSEHTKRNYESMVRVHVDPVLGTLPLSKVTGLDCQRFVNVMSKNGLAPVSVRRNAVVVKAIFGKAVSLGYIAKNPMDGVELPKASKPEIRPLDEDGVRDFLSAAQDSYYLNLYRLLLFTGARLSEAIAVDWGSVTDSEITISKQFPFKKTDTRFVPTKNKKSRKVPVTAQLKEALKDQKNRQDRQKRDPAFVNEMNLVFTDPYGGRIQTHAVWRDFRRIADGAGLEGTRIHDLRHTFATLALKAGVDPKTVSAILGHSSSAFTLDRYAFVTDTMIKDGADKLEVTFGDVLD